DAPRGRLADDPHGGTAHVHRRVDRHLELVAAQDAVITVGAVAAGAAAAALVPYGRAAPAARVGAADQGDGVAAGVHGEIDRSVDLVPTQDAVAAGGAVGAAATATAVLDRGAAPGAGLRIADDADGVAADVDRQGDRDVDLVAAQDAVITVGVGGGRAAADGHGRDGEACRGM